MASFSPSEKCYATGIYPEQDLTMNGTFTASEVRNEASNHWRLSDGPQQTLAGKMLRAFADRLEADERAVPVAYAAGLEANMRGFLDVMAWSEGEFTIPLYSHSAPADAEKRETMTPRELAKRIERGEKWKLADESARCQSQDAERLTEALRSIGERLSSVLCDPFGEVVVRGSDDDRQIIAQALKDLGELAAHSAQAQPPVASVTDAMKRAFEHLASIGYPKNARGNYDKDGEWTFSDAVPRDVDAREVNAAFHALKGALAAQENHNG